MDVLFDRAFDKPGLYRLSEADASSGDGIALLSAATKRTGLFGAVALDALDSRDPSGVAHSQERLLATRVPGLATGYFDFTDS